MEILQGARSTVHLVKVNGTLCVQKQYNDRKAPPAEKFARECAFYTHYDGLKVIPKFVSAIEPDTIIVTYVEGNRLIDLIKNQARDVDIRQISYHYGEGVSVFFNWPMSVSALEVCKHTILSIIENVKLAINQDKRYKISEIEQSADHLSCLLEAGSWWSHPMMCKYDWSASNMLVKDNQVTCIFDFDTGYIGSRLTFLGNILNSCLHLHWPSVRAGLTMNGVDLPDLSLLVSAGHFSMWQIALSSFVDGQFKWPSPEELCFKLQDLSEKAAIGY